MTGTNPAFANSNLAYSVGRQVELVFPFTITAGVPAYAGVEKPDILVEKGLAGSQVILAQTAINTLLGSTNEVVTATAFEATAMAADNTLGFVLDCDGQIDRIDHIEALVDIGAPGAVPGLGFGATTLASGAFTNPEMMVTASGNIAGRVLYTNLTATGTAGRLVVKCRALLK
jgi:hypothetical protein